ncbi:MAG: haloacid dehalogenase [Desulfobacterium sp.]|nr:haloacid dehalogenase [Desulfobacterium sp.]MBU3949576.1 haloacid dehalogenase [Pseudomonadota bacterium]
MIETASLAFDIDGVFADIMSLFIDIARDEYNIDNLLYQDISCYYIEECVDIKPEIISDIINKILDGKHSAPLKPIQGSTRVLNRLSREGPLLFVTARPYIGPIHNWISQTLSINPALVEVIATGSFEAKADVLLGKNISYFVEDRLETCFALNEKGVTPVVFKQPWNREKHPFLEVGSWDELESLINFNGSAR